MQTLPSYTLSISITVVNLVMIAFLLLILREGRNLVANRLLAVFCLAHGAGNLLSVTHAYNAYPLLIEVNTLLLLMVGPLGYLYLEAMTHVRFQFRGKHLLHALPILLYLAWLLPFKLQPIPNQTAQFYEWTSSRQSTPWMMLYYRKLVTLGYLVASYRIFVRHQRTIRELLADIEEKDLRWLKGLLVVLSGLYATWILNYEGLLPGIFFDLAHVAYSYWLAYYVIRQKAIYPPVALTVSLNTLDEQPKTRYRNSPMTLTEQQALVERIGQFMLAQKPYLNKDLTLTTLADQLGLSATQLSQALNEGLGVNFYTFVNRHRVEESKRLLVDPAFGHYNILGIAFEAGFNTKSTFNKTFREVVGQSPSDYQKRHSLSAPTPTNTFGKI